MNLYSGLMNRSAVTLCSAALALSLSPVSSHAATIVWDAWTLGTPSIVKSTFGAGTGKATPNTLEAQAATSVTHKPSSWFAENATTTIGLSSFFTVVAARNETAGDTVDGYLKGSLAGALYAAGLDIFKLTGSYNASVDANVDADFASWSNPGAGHSISGSVGLPIPIPIYNGVGDRFSVPGTLEVGKRYPFSMTLSVHADKTGIFQAWSKFGSGYFRANVYTAAPEPSTWLTMLVGISIVGAGLRFSRRINPECLT